VRVRRHTAGCGAAAPFSARPGMLAKGAAMSRLRANLLRRHFLAKASSSLPVRGAYPRAAGAAPDGAAGRIRPAISGLVSPAAARPASLLPRTAVRRETDPGAAFDRFSGHATARAADEPARTAYPLLMHALDTYQPLIDADLSEGMGITTRPWLQFADAAPSPSTIVEKLSVNKAERILNVQWADGHVSQYHFIWLRDHDCADINATNQRNTDTASIPLDISASDVQLVAGGRKLLVTWDSSVQGVISSSFDTAWLREHCYEHAQHVRRTQQTRAHRWGSELISFLPSLSVPYDEVLQTDVALLNLLRMVQRYGVAIISNTPVDNVASQRVVERIGPVRHTMYGGFWETRVLPSEDSSHIDSAFSTCALPAHTDGNYWRDPPGLQIFHCLHADPNGGDTLLVDGFQVAHKLQQEDPAALQLLSTRPVPFQHRDKDNHMVAYHTIIGCGPDGTVTRFSLNTLDRGSLHLSPDEVPQFYRAWKSLCDEVRRPSNEAWIKLEPGNLIVLNNRRVLHGECPHRVERHQRLERLTALSRFHTADLSEPPSGRSGISASSRRRLCGCYISYEDFTSKLSVLEEHARLGAVRGVGGVGGGRD